MKVIILETDRTIAKCIEEKFKSENINVVLASTAEEAITIADDMKPNAVICELALPAHSGTEFIYEFRTHPDWDVVPIIIYSSMKPSDEILGSRDWEMLNIKEFLYKPDVSLERLLSTTKESVK